MVNVLEVKTPEVKKTKNIADLNEVPVNMELTFREFEGKDGKPFSYYVYELNGEEYRVPNSVISQLQTHVVHNPNLKLVKVVKSGEGLETTYTVIAL